MFSDRFHNLYVAYSGFYEPEQTSIDIAEKEKIIKEENQTQQPSTQGQITSSSLPPQGESMMQSSTLTNSHVELTQLEFGILCALAGAGTALILMKLIKKST